MRYFVTGATGFIGGRLARQLVAGGHQVVAVARQPERAQDLTALGVEVHAGDITDKESMRAPMAGADGVFHVAGWYKIGARDSRPGERINVGGTRNVLELMSELAIPRGVYTSTLAVFSDTHGQMPDETYRHDAPWLTEYDRTKWAAHYQVALPAIQAGLPLVIVQPGLVYGPGDPSPIGEMLRQYLRRRLPIAPAGSAFCWAHVEDTARGHLLAMERGRPGESYIIAGPRHTLVEALELAERITGVPAPRLRPSPGVMRLLAAVMGPVGALLPLPGTYTAEAIRSSAGVTYLGSNAKARRELGFDPRPLEQGLLETLLAELAALRASGGQAQPA
jgi:nucleoside-diphosphate-sugar epimerase